VADSRGAPTLLDIWIKRRPPADRVPGNTGSVWVLAVTYRACGDEHAARLPIRGDAVAFEIDRLLARVAAGDRLASCDLYACLHAEWGRAGLVGRHPAWDAVFRHLALRAARVPARA
jgi:hypothetical protein